MGCSLDITTGTTRGTGGQAARLQPSRRWRRLAAATLVACTGTAAACSSGSSTGASAHAPIRVGYLLPLGGKIDKMIWVPSNSVDMSSYVSAIPSSTQAVWVVLSGSQAANFVNTYDSFGLKKKIPLMGITTLTDQAALPAENPAAAAGIYPDSQYCDGNPSSVNQQFANAYHAAYGVYPSYYSEAGYTKAQILIAALKSLHGNVTSEKALSNAMRAVAITAPRGPVSLNRATWSPVQNEYI